MALPKDEAELGTMLNEAKAAAAKQLAEDQRKILEGTTFPSVEDAVRSAREAAKKISEHSQELGELRKIKEDYEKLKSNASDSKVVDDDPNTVVGSITEEESVVLAKLYDKDENIRKAIDAGGMKAQADAIKSIRVIAVKPAVNPFKKKEKVVVGTAAIQELIKKALVSGDRRGLGVAQDRAPASGVETDAKAPFVRGGMSSYLKK